MTDNPKPKPPSFTEIANRLRTHIRDDMRPGDRVPSVRDLAKDYGAGVPAVQRALQTLDTEGLTTVVGKARIVATPPAPVTGASRFDRLMRSGVRYADGESVTGRWSGMRSVADPYVCMQLGLQGDEEVPVRRRVFEQNNVPTVLATSVFHPQVLVTVPEVMDLGVANYWMDDWSQRTGRTIERHPEIRTAQLAGEDELRHLRFPHTAGESIPVLVTYVTFTDAEAGPLCVFIDMYAPGLWQREEQR